MAMFLFGGNDVGNHLLARKNFAIMNIAILAVSPFLDCAEYF